MTHGLKHFPTQVEFRLLFGKGTRMSLDGRFIPYATVIIPDRAALGEHPKDQITDFYFEFEEDAAEFHEQLLSAYLKKIGLSA